MPLVTTDFRVPLEQIAGMLMSRWSQENFFKYMREEFNLDAMPVHRSVPAGRCWVFRAARQRSGAGRRPSASGSPNSGGRKLDALPGRDPPRPHPDDRLTRMMPAVAEAQGTNPRPRKTLAALFQTEADILPDPDNNILRVCIAEPPQMPPTTPSAARGTQQDPHRVPRNKPASSTNCHQTETRAPGKMVPVPEPDTGRGRDLAALRNLGLAEPAGRGMAARWRRIQPGRDK